MDEAVKSGKNTFRLPRKKRYEQQRLLFPRMPLHETKFDKFVFDRFNIEGKGAQVNEI
jgi:hypothetical protein